LDYIIQKKIQIVCYLKDFIKNLKDSTDSADLISRMDKLYPGRAAHICLELSTKILRDRYRWDGDYPPSLRETNCRAALKSRTCLKDDELLQINPGFRKRIMHLNPGLGTRQNEEEGADSG
jgi:hypothetical protein